MNKIKSLNIANSLYKSLKLISNRNYSSRNVLKLKERGMYQDIFPNTAAGDIVDLLNGSTQHVYAGFDPTANSLHMGNLLVLMNLLHWQRGGHQVIALVGGATGRIGDPSGRTTERVQLEADTVMENVQKIAQNIETIFGNHKKYLWKDSDNLKPVIYVNNEDWYKDMNVIEFVGTIGKHFRMGTMLLKHSVQSRINSSAGMSFMEFTYQLFQSYDWLHLLQKYDCRFQIGGSDQLGNISAGHEFISRVAKKDVYGLTLPLLTTEEGDKFGKSAGNALWLDPEKTSPFSIYQYLIRTKDSEVEKLLKLYTFYTIGQVKDIMSKHEANLEQRHAQQCLADQVTLLIHGENGLKQAKLATEAIYSKDISSLVSLHEKDVMQIFQGATVVNLLLEPGLTVFDVAMKANCFPTENDAMRIISAGGFYINHQRVAKISEVITESAHILPNMLSLVRVGKRNYYIIKWQS